MFGSDEFADIGNMPVFRFDAGADQYEQFQFLISTYENRYIFDNFRRSRPTFDTHVQVTRAQSRYFDKIQQMTKGLALMLESYGNDHVRARTTPLTTGSRSSSTIMRPEPGPTRSRTAARVSCCARAAEDINGQINNPAGDFIVPGLRRRTLHRERLRLHPRLLVGDYQTKVGRRSASQSRT
jgi:hypothetical protein